MDREVAYRQVRIDRDRPSPQNLSFLVSLAKNSGLANHVETFIYDGSTMWERHDNNHMDKVRQADLPELPDPEIYNLLVSRIDALGLGDEHAQGMRQAVKAQCLEVQGVETGLQGNGFNQPRYIDSPFTASAAVLVLSMCERITTLHISDVHSESVVGEYLRRNNYGELPSPRLQRLRRVEMDGETSVEPLEVLQYCHRLPALESFVVERHQVYQPYHLTTFPRIAGFRELRIEYVDLDSSVAMLLLAAPRALERFVLRLGGVSSTDGGSPTMSFPELGRRLRWHRATLQSVDVDLSVCHRSYPEIKDGTEEYEDKEYATEFVANHWGLRSYGEEYHELDKALSVENKQEGDDMRIKVAEYGSSVGSFRDFEKLTSLSVSVNVFVGEKVPFRLVDALPASLESFCLYEYARGDDEHVDVQIDEFLQLKDERFPKLTNIRGIDETVPGVKMTYGAEPGEEDAREEVWEEREKKMGWVEAEL